MRLHDTTVFCCWLGKKGERKKMKTIFLLVLFLNCGTIVVERQ